MFRMFKMWGVVSAVLMLGAILGLGPALAASAQSSYFTQIAQAYKGKGVYVWSDGDRPDAFTAVEQDRFDSRIKQLTSPDNPDRLPLRLFVAQVEYGAAAAATPDGYSPNEMLAKAMRRLGYTPDFVLVTIDGGELDARAYGSDISTDFLDGLDETMEDINGDESNWDNPVRLLDSWLDALEDRDDPNIWGDAATGVSSPSPTATAAEPVPTPAVTVTVTPTPSPTASASPVETTTTGLRQPVKLWQVLLIGGVCLAILIGVIVWANHFRSKRE